MTSYTPTASMGPLFAGQAVGYSVTPAAGGAPLVAWTTAGVTESRTTPGDFAAPPVALDDHAVVVISWGPTGRRTAASETVDVAALASVVTPFVPAAQPPNVLAQVYATDEDLYREGSGDFATLASKSSVLAAGDDGVFYPGTPWTLHSASNTFAAQGVTPGMVLQLTGPPQLYKATDYLAVDAAGSSTLTLRRCGFTAGQGMPPGPPAGVSGVSFKVASLLPQIETASFALNERFGIDPALPGYRGASDVYNLRVLRRMTVLKVFHGQYAALNRAKAGDFADKLSTYADEFAEEIDRASLRWGPTGTAQQTSTRFSTRLSR